MTKISKGTKKIGLVTESDLTCYLDNFCRKVTI